MSGNNITLLWWEYEQLMDHILSREDIWTCSRENMWLRQTTREDGEGLLGLAISPPVSTSPFRVFALRWVPLAWDSGQCEEYMYSLVRKWTSYGDRVRYAQFLTDEGGIESGKAQALATGLCGISEAVVYNDPERTPLPTQQELWPDIDGPQLSRIPYHERCIRSYGLVGGGWITIRVQGQMLRVRCSLRSDGKYGGGYDGAFEGFIRPRNGNVELAAAFLFGKDSPCPDGAELIAREFDPMSAGIKDVGIARDRLTGERLPIEDPDRKEDTPPELRRVESGDDQRSGDGDIAGSGVELEGVPEALDPDNQSERHDG